jgi:succinoglycan biosynthesis transport protein ExoP
MSDSSHKPSVAGVREEEDIVQRRTLRDYYIILRERVWVALPIALLVAIGYGYIEYRQTPMYSANVKLQFDKPLSVTTAQAVQDTGVKSEVDINTYIQNLASNSLRSRVIESFSPEDQKTILRPAMRRLQPGQPPPSVSSMLGTVDPEPVGKSYFIQVTVNHQDPDAAAIIANHYAAAFLKQLLDNMSGVNTGAVGDLNDRVKTLAQESEAAQQKLEDYMHKNNMVSGDASVNLVADNLKTVNGSLTQAKLSLLKGQGVQQQVAEYQRNHQDLLQIDYIANQPAISSLNSQLTSLKQARAALAEKYGDRHPRMIDTDNQIGIVTDELQKQIAQAVAGLDTTVSGLSEQVNALEKEYLTHEREEESMRALSGEYAILKDQADQAEANYSSVIHRLNENRNTSTLESIPVHLVDAALPNYTPYSPNKSSINRTCIALGLFTFVGIAVGLSFIDDRIKSAWDIENFIGVNLLGIVPDLAGLKTEDKYTMMLEGKDSPGVEPFLGIYSAIKIQSKLDFPKSILVTSTIPGEGKTLVSSNIAGAFARHGKRTILIDCDLRRPMMHRHFKLPNTNGVITWFEAGANLDGELATNPNLGVTKIGSNFWLLPSGGRSKAPTGMLENPVFVQLIEKLKREFDLVVIDSPPLGAVTDALLLAESADEVVYVCRFNRAYRKHIKLYMRTLQKYGKNIVLGIVLNGLSPRRIEYYSNYRYYRSYKKYYGTQT